MSKCILLSSTLKIEEQPFVNQTEPLGTRNSHPIRAPRLGTIPRIPYVTCNELRKTNGGDV